ncbi:hypothetical protein, partial [Flavobacterium frigoris]|uniref:hypothetical protein n=1 Tax=Flavobacterium frigoris TaxID=229204 RepID=UPI001110597F
MKTVNKFIYLFLPLYIGCAMGVQSEDFDAVNFNTETLATDNKTMSTSSEDSAVVTSLINEVKSTEDKKTTTIASTKKSATIQPKQNNVKAFT